MRPTGAPYLAVGFALLASAPLALAIAMGVASVLDSMVVVIAGIVYACAVAITAIAILGIGIAGRVKTRHGHGVNRTGGLYSPVAFALLASAPLALGVAHVLESSASSVTDSLLVPGSVAIAAFVSLGIAIALRRA